MPTQPLRKDKEEPDTKEQLQSQSPELQESQDVGHLVDVMLLERCHIITLYQWSYCS